VDGGGLKTAAVTRTAGPTGIDAFEDRRPGGVPCIPYYQARGQP
jgi:hypothetical protein